MTWKPVVAAVALVLIVLAYQRVSTVLGQDVIQEPSAPMTPATDTPLKFTMKDIDGKDVNLADYKGKVVLIVNVASKCGFTPQYTALEKLYTDYQAKGFVVLGFPANNFKSQEPGTDADIKAFCTGKYDVTFPIFSKVSVAGKDQTPLYKFLTEPETNGKLAGPIGWNFTKFLIDKNGHVFARFASKTKPDDKEVIAAIEKGLKG